MGKNNYGNRNNNNNRQPQQQAAAPTPAPQSATPPADETLTPADEATQAANAQQNAADAAEQNGQQEADAAEQTSGTTEEKSDENQGQSDQSQGEPTPETAETPAEEPEDKVVTAETVAEPDPAPVVAETPVDTSVDENDPVEKLKRLLEDYVEANSVIGQKPEDYRESAKKALAVTRFVTRTPTNEVLTQLLEFFEENKDTQLNNQFMLGSTTLASDDERKVGFLYSLFSSLALRQNTRFETSVIAQILGKQEIVTFYQRRRAVNLQNRQA